MHEASESYLKSEDQEKLAIAITQMKNVISQLYPNSFEAQQIKDAVRLLESMDIDLKSAYETWYSRLTKKENLDFDQ